VGEGAGFDPDQISCRTFRATGITTSLEYGSELKTTLHIAGHASAGTTKLSNYRDRNVEQ
jgi:hypothetical protein